VSRKVNAELPDPPIGYHEQSLVYYPGDGMPVVINDQAELGADNPVLYLNDRQIRLFCERIAWITRMIKDATDTRDQEARDERTARIKDAGGLIGVKDF
jgi:hypothetical protein